MNSLDNTYEGRAPMIVVGIMMLVLFLAGVSSAATITVNASGGSDYTKIQDAIDNASAGDTILVYSGTYFENVNVDKQLILKGIDNGGSKPVVNAQRRGSAITLTSNGITLEGFNVTNSSLMGWPNAGIKLVYSSHNNITGNNASDNSDGINLYSSNNNTITGNSINNNRFGIYLWQYSNNNLLKNNNVNDNYNGIYLFDSTYNVLSKNVMFRSNYYNFGLSFYNGFDPGNDIDTSNLVDGKPLYYIKNAVNIIYDSSSNAGTFYCINCVNVTIKDLNLSGNYAGIFIWNTTESRIQNVSISNNDVGISLHSSCNNTLSDNKAYRNFYGVYLRTSCNNILSNNIANNNSEGIFLTGMSINNVIMGNNANNNIAGVYLDYSDYNDIKDNTASNIYLYSSNNNYIYNNFFDNVSDYNFYSINIWNITKTNGTNIIGGPYLGGNFWGKPGGTGFSQTCTDSNNDGICDSPYTLDSSNIDYLPLVYKPAITPTPSLLFAITPNSRNAQVGTPVTLFMSVINYGTGTANDVSLTQASNLPATVSYQQWNSTAFIGSPNTPVDMVAGNTANFVITIDATSAFNSSSLTFNVSGTNVAAAPVSAVNTLTMSASSTPSADVIMMSTSLDVSTGVNTATAFAVATANVGGASATGVSLLMDIPDTITGLKYQLNETYPANGTIKGPATGLTIGIGARPTFAVFLTPTRPIAYDPANNRITLQLVNGSGRVIGAQSMAVHTT